MRRDFEMRATNVPLMGIEGEIYRAFEPEWC